MCVCVCTYIHVTHCYVHYNIVQVTYNSMVYIVQCVCMYVCSLYCCYRQVVLYGIYICICVCVYVFSFYLFIYLCFAVTWIQVGAAAGGHTQIQSATQNREELTQQITRRAQLKRQLVFLIAKQRPELSARNSGSSHSNYLGIKGKDRSINQSIYTGSYICYVCIYVTY